MADTDKIAKTDKADAGALLKAVVSNPLLVILFTIAGGFGGQSLFGVSKDALEAKFTVMQSKQDQVLENQKDAKLEIEQIKQRLSRLEAQGGK